MFEEKVPDKVIVFSSSKQKVRDITRSLKRMNLLAEEIHSDLEQARRDEALLAFRNGKINILVATDIVSRGIDIENIDMVINFDVPSDVEDYIHRIGRSARAQKTGKGITFISNEEQNKFFRIEKFLGKEIEKQKVPEVLGEVPEYAPKDVSNGGKKWRGKNHQRRSGQRNIGGQEKQVRSEYKNGTSGEKKYKKRPSYRPQKGGGDNKGKV
jgi:superfamily II DNA/RNA helicase